MEYSESDSYNKNIIKEKANELVRFHKAVKEKLKTPSYFLKKSDSHFGTCRPESTVQNILMSMNTFWELHKKSKKYEAY